MNELNDIYNKHKECNGIFYLLGTHTPSDVEEYDTEELIKYFLYTYSSLGLTSTEIISIKELECKLFSELNSLKFYNTLTNKQKWWGLSLIYLRIGAEYYQFNFFYNMLTTLIDKLIYLSIDDLPIYCNIMNDTLGNNVGYELRIRPSCDNNKESYISETYLKLTIHRDEIIDLFKKSLSLECMINDDVINEKETLDQIGFQYDPWFIVFDIFVGQILIGLESPIANEIIKNDLPSAVEIALLNLMSNSNQLPNCLDSISKEISTYLK